MFKPVTPLTPHSVYMTEDGLTRRVIYSLPGLDNCYLVVKLFTGTAGEDDAPTTFKFWYTKDLAKTVSFWRTQKRVDDLNAYALAVRDADHRIVTILSGIMNHFNG